MAFGYWSMKGYIEDLIWAVAFRSDGSGLVQHVQPAVAWLTVERGRDGGKLRRRTAKTSSLASRVNGERWRSKRSGRGSHLEK